MLKTPPHTQAAFLALLNALEAEIKELQAAGQQRFHAGIKWGIEWGQAL